MGSTTFIKSKEDFEKHYLAKGRKMTDLREALTQVIETKTYDYDDPDDVVNLLVKAIENRSVLPTWVFELPMQQQSVLMLALRGPDGIRKYHPMKKIQQSYRASVVKAALYGRMMRMEDEGDNFMNPSAIFTHETDEFGNVIDHVKIYFQHIDEMPHHFHNHLKDGAQILGYKHPDEDIRKFWNDFYLKCAADAHLMPEPQEVMDKRLGDWDQLYWDQDNAD